MPTYTLTATQLNNRILNSFSIPSSAAPVIIVDPNAQAFVTAAGITDPTQQVAIDNLVISLKANNIWTKMRAIYPFVGGTATTHKWNLKDPRDLNAAFRLAFTGAWIHSSNGIQGNSFNGYVNTYLDPATTFGTFVYSGHFSVYSRTIVPSTPEGVVYTDVGVSNNLGDDYLGSWTGDIGFGPGVTQYGSQQTGEVYYNLTNASLNTQGLFTVSRVGENSLVLYRNSTALGSSTAGSLGWSNDLTLIGQDNLASGVKKQYAFATIGTGLTNTDTSNLYTAVQAFQTTLGRQV
jgi:hypothetical protein